MKTKIYAGRDLIGRFSCTGKESFRSRWARRMKRAVIGAGIFSVFSWSLLGVYQYGKLTAEPKIVKAEVVKEVPVQNEFPPILKKICTAESGWKQFGKDGRVIRNKKTPSDLGICQIHETIWNDKARELGYDIYTEQGNKDMAVWIFEHYGTDPWNSSRDILNGWGK